MDDSMDVVMDEARDEDLHPKISLPTEILAKICKYVKEKKDLRNIRLLSKSFDAAAAPLVFKEIRLSPRYAAIEVAIYLAQRFGPFIETLTYSHDQAFQWTWVEFAEIVEENECPIEHGCGDRHLRLHWARLHQLEEERQQLITSGDMHAQLCNLLRALPRVSRILLPSLLPPTGKTGKDYLCVCRKIVLDAERRNINPLVPDTICAEGFQRKHLSTSYPCVCQRQHSLPQLDQAWPFILSAISSTRKETITEIIVGNRYSKEEKYLDPTALLMSPQQRLDAINVLPKLTSMTLKIDLHKYFNSDRVLTLPTQEGRDYSEAIRMAVNLEFLRLQTEYPCCKQRNGIPDSETAFHILLHDCVLPKLKHLRIGEMSIPEQSLLGFLQNSPRLEYIRLEEPHLTSGAWTTVDDYLSSRYGIKDRGRGSRSPVSGRFAELTDPSTGRWTFYNWNF